MTREKVTGEERRATIALAPSRRHRRCPPRLSRGGAGLSPLRL